MLIEQLRGYTDSAKDEYAMRLAQQRTFSHVTRSTNYTSFKEDPMSLAEKAKAKAAALRAKKSTDNKKPAAKAAKSTAKKTSSKKESTRQPRTQIKDKKGHVVTGRDNTFTCVECGNEITGPWSYKTHLVKQHGYSRKKAGLREE